MQVACLALKRDLCLNVVLVFEVSTIEVIHSSLLESPVGVPAACAYCDSCYNV